MEDSAESVIDDFYSWIENEFPGEIIKVELSPLGNVIALDKIFSMIRGKGNADKALKYLIFLCDEAHKDIRLIPHALDDATSDRQLLVWYRGNGFVQKQSDDLEEPQSFLFRSFER